ncbi:MAG: dTDP-glucose 4,6-dehydratase [Bacteriovoracaceae bacterium]
MNKKTILLTGCAGFIGSNFLKRIACSEENKRDYNFVVVDALTYAGHYPTIQKDIEQNKHLSFYKIDLRDQEQVKDLFEKYLFNGVIHFAAESHVDRSITNPNIFVETNVLGTLNLLNASLKTFKDKNVTDFRFLQIGTDEVYGTLSFNDPAFTEETPIQPNSPYSASKASADLLVRSFYETFKLPTLITRCSNNYGPFQFPEKLIPLMIDQANQNKKLPVYGKGENVRDWIYVDDHNDGVWAVYLKGRVGEVYNLGGNAEKKNIDVVKLILKSLNKDESLINYVIDRLGHDLRYAMDFTKIHNELGWSPKVTFEQGLSSTIKWYLANQEWVRSVQTKKL